MKYWTEYNGHEIILQGKRNRYDGTIYTFDIETTSYIVLNGKQLNTLDYLNLSKKEQDLCLKNAMMYIWSFGINDTIYYGRTWEELDAFMDRIEKFGTPKKKFIYVHNLAFEFQFLRNYFEFKSVFARKSRKVIKCELEKYNFEFRCTYYMSNCSLKKLADIYRLDIHKLVGDLDYNKIRHNKTQLTEKELKYCEYDCLIVYKYILKELETYKTLKAIPITSTGHVRKELKEKIDKNWDYLNKTRKAINIDGHIYNLMVEAFAGGYTHANWTKADEIIKKVTSYDFTSSYPFVMVSEKYPMSEFKKCNFVKTIEQILDCFCYIVVVKFYNIQCKYLNNFISENKCRLIKKGKYDNGRVIGAEELEIVVTDVDLKFLYESYNFTSCEFLEVYYAKKDYLPKDYIDFILQKYVNKTEYKNVVGKETEYMLEKNKFNSLYGMTVTNNIKDNVIYDNEIGWYEEKLTDEVILDMLKKEKDKGYLSFSWGVWVTAYARFNLLSNLIKLDNYVIYSDTDSLKLESGFDESIINNYNTNVIKKLEKVSKDLDISFDKFSPKDKDGIAHTLGLFENDGEYEEFITQGAKKYAYTKWIKNSKLIDTKTGKFKKGINIQKKGIEKSIVLEITVSGVPKSGAKALKKLSDFKDNLIFDFKDTDKYVIMYNDNEEPFELTDYNGIKYKVKEKYGCCLLPTTYTLGKSEEYIELLSDLSSARAIYGGD